MTEALRRVTIEAELPEELAAEMEQAIADGQFRSVAEVVESALTLWSYERWPQVDPEGWREHVADMRRRVEEADAHPEDSLDADAFFAELLTEVDAAVREAERPTATE